MVMDRKKNSYVLIALAALLMLALSACGYRAVSTPGAASVRIGTIHNNTAEAGLDDALRRAITVEFQRNGIKVRNSAEHSIGGTLSRVVITTISEADRISSAYRVEIYGDFSLAGPDGGVRPLPATGKYIVTFSGEGDLAGVAASKERALKEAVADLAGELAASVLLMQ